MLRGNTLGEVLDLHKESIINKDIHVRVDQKDLRRSSHHVPCQGPSVRPP